MHRSLQALQYYTSHSVTDIKRLHERIRSNINSSGSLTDTFIRLTGSPPTVPFKKDQVSVEDWNLYLSGKHNDTLADFYATLVARPILEEDGPLPTESEIHIEPLLSRTYRETESLQQRNVKSRVGANHKRKIPWGWLGLLVLCFLLGAGGTYAYSNYIDRPAIPDPKTTVNKTTSPEKGQKENEKENVSKEKTEPDVLYVTARNSNVFSDSSLTDVLYEADFGDGYKILESNDDISKIELTDELTGYIKNVDTTKSLKGASVTDEPLLTWIDDHLDTSFVKETLTDLMGQTADELKTTYGEPERTFADKVNTYLFYGNHFFTLQNNKVIAIDWSEATVTNAELATLAPLQLKTETTGLITSNSYRLQRFEKPGTTFSRVRLAEQQL